MTGIKDEGDGGNGETGVGKTLRSGNTYSDLKRCPVGFAETSLSTGVDYLSSARDEGTMAAKVDLLSRYRSSNGQYYG
jgi:hypothetical protein